MGECEKFLLHNTLITWKSLEKWKNWCFKKITVKKKKMIFWTHSKKSKTRAVVDCFGRKISWQRTRTMSYILADKFKAMVRNDVNRAVVDKIKCTRAIVNDLKGWSIVRTEENEDNHLWIQELNILKNTRNSFFLLVEN